jgi:hypothetical protein
MELSPNGGVQCFAAPAVGPLPEVNVERSRRAAKRQTGEVARLLETGR